MTRPAYRWLVGPAAGGYQTELTAAKSRRLTLRLEDQHEASFRINGQHRQAAAIDELTTDLHVLRAGAPLYRGRIGPTGDAGDPAGNPPLATTVASWDYRAILNHRGLYSTDTLIYGSQDQSLLAWTLLNQTQLRAGGNLHIVRGLGQTTGVNRARTYQAGDNIGQRLVELSQASDGFDWDLVPPDQQQLSFDVFYPSRGTNRGIVLEYGGLVRTFRRTVDPSTFANAGRITGAEGLNAIEWEALDLATRDEGRFDGVYGYTEVLTQSALSDRQVWQAEQAQTLTPVYELELVKTRRSDGSPGWGGPQHIGLGDPVQVRIKAEPRLAVDTQLRVHEIQIDLSDEGDETVTVVAGGPRPDPRRRLARVLQRLRDLERR